MSQLVSITSRMGTLLKFVFCALITGTKVLTAQSAVYSSPNIAQKFSQCLVENLSESIFFTPDDIKSITEVADVMNQGMKSAGYDPRSPFSVKILLIAFVTSLADVIIIEDHSKNIFRKGVYAVSLEQCSMSTIGYIDSEFIKESLRIISTLEESKSPKLRKESPFGGAGFSAAGIYNPAIYPPPSAVFNPYAVVPAPVQSPFVQVDSNPNDKTIFDLPQNPHDFSPFSPTSDSGANTRFPVKSGSETQFADSSKSQVGGDSISSQYKSEIAQSEHDYTFGESFVAPSFDFGGINVRPPKRGSDSSSLKETSQKTSSNLEGLKIPQMKESSIHVIPPIIRAQNVESAPSQDRPFPQRSEALYQPSTEISSPQKESSFAMTSSVSLPQTDEKGRNVQFNPTLESLISNILLNSKEFRDSFSSEINTRSAVSLARVITEQTLSGYNSDVIKEALNAVSNAVATVRISSPENYALALSNALVSVLKLHDLPLFVDGSRIATSLIFNLGTTLPESTEATDGQFNKHFTPDSNVQWEVNEPPIDFHQTSEFAPEDVSGEIFNKALSQYLLNSEEMANFFCSSDTLPNRLQIYFNAIKSSLSEFGLQIATLGAGLTSSILSELSNEDLCSNYGKAISDAIAEILDENGLLPAANAEDISNRMVFSLNQYINAYTQSQKPEIAVDGGPVEDITNLPSETMPVLQSSFSTNFDQSDQETSALPDIYYRSSTYSSSSFEDMNYRTPSEPPVNYDIEPVSHSNPASFSPFEVSPAEELKQTREIKNDYTSPLSSDISDEEYSFSTTWMESLSSLSEPSATEKPAHSDADYMIPVISDDIIDQEKLASFLLEEIESSLDALNSKDSDQETTSNLPIYDTSETETETIPASNNPRTNTNGNQAKQSNNSRNLQQNRRSRKIQGTSQSLPVSSSPQIQDSVVDDDITLPHHRVKGRSSRRHPESIARVEEEASSTPGSHSKSSNFQLPPEVLQPSFQARQSSESLPASSKVRPQAPLTRPYDFDYEDESFVFAKAVSRIAADSIAFIRSGRFDIWELCGRLNKLAPILRIPPLDVCEEIPAIDYLLHALRSLTKILKGV